VDRESVGLTALLESIADGHCSDVHDDERSRLTDSEQRLVSHLRVIASISALHRNLIEEESDRDADGGNGTPASRWGGLELLKKIGQGAFGEVYLARDVLLQRQVALKLLRSRAGSEAMASRVLREGRSLARLRHPNVVAIYGVEHHEGQIGLQMELVRGRTLEEVLQADGPIGAREAASIGQDLCRALTAIHGVGLLHRDVKCQNVIREHDGRIVLMDFGSGADGEELLNVPSTGSPLYLAPEVLAGAAATVRSDIYSLGVLLYHLVTGDYPVKAETIDGLRSAHASAGSGRGADPAVALLDSPVGRAIARALSPTPENRPESAAAFQEMLADASAAEEPAAGVAVRSRLRRGTLALLLTLGAVAAIGAMLAMRRAALAPPTISTIAVLPFENLSSDSKEQYLANAVPMELTAKLGLIGGIKVVPWSLTRKTSGARPPGKEGPLASSDALVDGSVQLLEASGGKEPNVRVRVQLYRAGTGQLIWSDTFDRALGSVLTLQLEIAREIAGRLRVVLARREQLMLARQVQAPAAAMEFYLKARLAWEEYASDFEGAITLFKKAIAIDPNFAAAYAGLADCYTLQSAYAGSTSSGEALARAIDAANVAIQLDPSDGEFWATRGFARMALKWDWSGAMTDYQRALELSPGSAVVHSSHASFLIATGDVERAIAEAKVAEDRSPYSLVISRRVAWCYYMGRRYDDAIAQLRKTLAIDAGYSPAHTLLGRALVMNGDFENGLREFGPVPRGFEALLAQLNAVAGREDEARELLGRAESPAGSATTLSYQIAAAYAAMGMDGDAIRWLTRALDEHDAGLCNLTTDPMFDRIRANPAFQGILRSTGVAERAKERNAA
jgi:eukaryotic-like serine/threonine-protein kinase